jgi:signal transduction histidine kinase
VNYFRGRAGLFLLAVALVATLAGCERAPETRPQARNGVLDLTNYDIQSRGPVALDGQWEFYWDKLLGPEDFNDPAKIPPMTGYLNFPGTWKGFALGDSPLGDRGQATFRLRILPGPGEKNLMLRLFDLRYAYTLWVNGSLAAESGTPGTDAATEKPAPSLVLANVAAHGSPLDLVLRISNYNSIRGGVPSSILLGTPGALEQRHLRVWGITLVMIGSLLVMGLYHFFLFFQKKYNFTYLYFGLLCLLWMGYFIFSDVTETVVNLFVAAISPLIFYKIHMACYLVSRPIGYRFMRSLYPQEFHRVIQQVVDAASVVFLLILLCFPLYLSSRAIVFSFYFTMIIIIYSIWRLVVCIQRGRDAAIFILFGYGVMAVLGINSMLTLAGFIHPNYRLESGITLLFGMFLYILSQAQALAQRFSNAFSRAQSLSAALERNNRALRQEMAERNRLEREIVHISEEERRRISHELHDGLCQHLTSARLSCSLLEDQLAEGAAAGELARLSRQLDDSVDGAYGLSRGLWPVEHDPKAPGPSLEDLVRRLAGASGIDVELRQELGCAKCVNPHLTLLHRIAQEALANAVKHAKAGRIRVSLCCSLPGRLVLSVADNGVGRVAAGSSVGGLGLEIMAHRARIIEADLEIIDAPGGGTEVRCTAPCPCPPALAPGHES